MFNGGVNILDDVSVRLLVAPAHPFVPPSAARTVPFEYQEGVIDLVLVHVDQLIGRVLLHSYVHIFETPAAVEREDLGPAPHAPIVGLEIANQMRVRVGVVGNLSSYSSLRLQSPFPTRIGKQEGRISQLAAWQALPRC